MAGRSYMEFREKLLADLSHNGYTEREVEIVEEALGIWQGANALLYAFGQGFGKARKKRKKVAAIDSPKAKDEQEA